MNDHERKFFAAYSRLAREIHTDYRHGNARLVIALALSVVVHAILLGAALTATS